MPNNGDPYCRVCGLLQATPPWGDDGRSPTWEICACCGTEFGYQDATPAGVLRARQAWTAKGYPWFQESERPPGWRAEDQLVHAQLLQNDSDSGR
ncbi:hypothetical protein B0I32_111207 [Nonomuraea fuscirosea]|uniref:Uncharacterized protein n=1 Tax=Nonomuraea fuscirosea TaxID=1291556 RepID=A0A2T0MW84_9ACTN|nr:hypothetical protein [Nonomuraea fuscirosea]PRX63213.1 hypothetical protein B0I32_111207 [Nonomuraea fuscirosea]